MKETKKPIVGSTRTTWFVIAGIAALVLLASTVRTPKHRVPEELLGEWHTSDPNYSDRFFEVTPVSITFTTGGTTGSTGMIKQVTTVLDGNRILYTVQYDLEGVHNEVSFYLETGTPNGDVIRFKNQPHTIWTRIEGT
jgi:hypothetical protein